MRMDVEPRTGAKLTDMKLIQPSVDEIIKGIRKSRNNGDIWHLILKRH